MPNLSDADWAYLEVRKKDSRSNYISQKECVCKVENKCSCDPEVLAEFNKYKHIKTEKNKMFKNKSLMYNIGMDKKVTFRKIKTKPVDLSINRQFTFQGVVRSIGRNSIRVSRGDTKSSLWLDTQKTELKDIQPGDSCTFNVVIRTFEGKDFVIKTKLYLMGIEKCPVENLNSDPFECSINCEVVQSTKTDIPGLYVLRVIRIEPTSDEGQECESYDIRYFIKEENPLHIDLGKYLITFSIENTSTMIMTNGETFKTESIEHFERDGIPQTRTSLVYIPTLSATKLMKINKEN